MSYITLCVQYQFGQVNQIEEKRKEINKYFDPNLKIKDSEQVLLSPTNKYRIETAEFHQKKSNLNWDVTKVDIFDNDSNDKLFSLIINHDLFSHIWLTKNDLEYLVCSEDIYGGQTVIELTSRKLSSYSPGSNGFIATDYYLSPDKNVLAVQGCIWGGPYYLKIFRFDDPLDLPLQAIAEVDIPKGCNENIKWLDNETLKFQTKENEETLVKIGTAHNKVHKSWRGSV
jgi:hypothetical protein